MGSQITASEQKMRRPGCLLGLIDIRGREPETRRLDNSVAARYVLWSSEPMSNMWLPDGEDPRDFSATRGERDTVLMYLRNYRLAFELKCQGLDADALARRSVPPSSMSLLGLLRHLAKVEHIWFRRCLQQQVDIPRLYSAEPDLDFNGAIADPAVVEEAWAAWRREVEDADAWLDQGTPFDALVPWEGDDLEVRDVLVHLVEEYARHLGHADLIRECIDGRTGQ
jgi:uncharacterized damage-inducible protein DinB